jgi:hypothetical protein
MTNRPSIFAYLVFGPEGVSVEGIARPMKIAAWHGPGATLGVQAKIRTVQSWISFRLGFIQNRFYLYFAWWTILRPSLRI